MKLNRAYKVSFLIFLVGLFLSLFLFFLVNGWEKKRLELEFNLRVSERVRMIQEVVLDHLSVLYSIGDFYAASKDIRRDEFRLFTQSIFARHKDILVLDWLPRVFDADRGAFEKMARQEGLEDYFIKDLSPEGKFIPAARRTEYFPIFFMEPSGKDFSFFGFDVASSPERFKAMQEACDLGQAMSTHASVLFRGLRGKYVFRLFLPIYEEVSGVLQSTEERRRSLIGFVSLLSSMGILVESAIEDSRPLGLDTYIFDLSAPGGQRLIYEHKARLRDVPFSAKYVAQVFSSGLEARKMIQLAGHNWLVICKPALSFFAYYVTPQAWIVLGVGLFLSILLGIYSFEILSRSGKVERLVLARTSELTQANEALAKEALARQRVAADLQKLTRSHELILESAGDGIFGLDLEGRHTFVNPAAAKMLGYEPSELIGKPSHKIWHHTYADGLPYPEEECPIYMAYKDGIIHRGSDEIFWRKDGTSFAVEYISRPIREGKKLIGAVVSFIDIAERKHFEEELLRSNRELEQFAYATSHDLQEPLRMIGSYVDLLSRRYKGKLDAEADEFIGYVVEGVDRMHLLITDLLEYAHMAARKKTLETIDMNHVLENVMKNLRLSIEESQAVITHDHLPFILADFHQMGILFQNILSNAIKFRAEKSPLIHVSVRKNEQEEWEFSVRDNGVGFESQYAERIFGIFQRLHTQREYAGTGIGLALCKKIIDNHGGRIWAHSELNKGSTFYFTMPIS
ncbi:MAG: CHASE domain-containing protein [Candidatus Omnitrophota bacterium]